MFRGCCHCSSYTLECTRWGEMHTFGNASTSYWSNKISASGGASAGNQKVVKMHEDVFCDLWYMWSTEKEMSIQIPSDIKQTVLTAAVKKETYRPWWSLSAFCCDEYQKTGLEPSSALPGHGRSWFFKTICSPEPPELKKKKSTNINHYRYCLPKNFFSFPVLFFMILNYHLSFAVLHGWVLSS